MSRILKDCLGLGVTFYLFKNRSSGARVLLPTSRAGGALTFHGKLNEELKLELVPNFQSRSEERRVGKECRP